MIQGHGNSGASIMLIGDGGGKGEQETNYALTGFNEVTLNQTISGSFHLKETWRTLLVKDTISFMPGGPKGKTPYYELITDKIKSDAPVLLEEIEAIKPNLLIPLGEASFRFLTDLQGIRKFRGSILMSKPLKDNHQYKVLPILGPMPYLNQEYKLRWVSRLDFRKAPRYANDIVPPDSKLNIWVCKTASALRTFLERSYKPDGLLVFDIETFLGIPTCISFCFNGEESVCIPFLDKSIDLDNRVLMIEQVSKVLASPIAKCNQNIKYDLKRLETFNFEINNITGDTLLAAACLYPEFPKNLGFLTSIYTEIPYFKDEGRQFDATKHHKNQFYLYNAKDSLATWQIHQAQKAELDEVGSTEVYNNLVSLIPIYKKMEFTGLCVDNATRLRLYTKYTSLLAVQLSTVRALSNRPEFNPLSPKQCEELIFKDMAYNRPRQVKGTDEESLEFLQVFGFSRIKPELSKAILNGIINCRKIHKVIEYLETEVYPDGNWRSEYNLAGTETGRSSAGSSKSSLSGGYTTDELVTIEKSKKGIKSIITKLGRSFQTIAKHGFKIEGEEYGKDLRAMFVPPSGYAFVEIDLSQAEARVDAVLAGNFDILSVFDSPTGIHRLTGSWVFNCKPEEIKKNTEEYQMAKTVRHAGERNMKAERLQMMTQKPLKECERVLETFHKFQPEIRGVFHRSVIFCIDNSRTLVAPNGRRRMFLDRIDQHTYNEAISYLPQAIVSDQTKFSLIPTYKACDDFALLQNEAHDGTLAAVRVDKIGDYITEYKKNVESSIDFRRGSIVRDISLVIPSEAQVSYTNWLELEDWKG